MNYLPIKLILLTLLSLLSMMGQAQRNYTVYLEGSYQPYDRKAASLGVSYHKKTNWPDLAMDTYLTNTLYGTFFFDNFQDKQVYAAGYRFLWGINYAYLGADVRHVFHNNGHRIDLGPAGRVGYRFIWLDYSANFLGTNNLFSSDPENAPKVPFKRIEHNLRLTLTIPIIKK